MHSSPEAVPKLLSTHLFNQWSMGNRAQEFMWLIKNVTNLAVLYATL